MSKQAKDAARKKAAAAMRDIVSKQGKAYDRIVKELDRDQFREYILSVRHKPAGDAQPEAILSDWLPICEVVVADRQQYEVRRRRPAANARRRLPVASPDAPTRPSPAPTDRRASSSAPPREPVPRAPFPPSTLDARRSRASRP